MASLWVALDLLDMGDRRISGTRYKIYRPSMYFSFLYNVRTNRPHTHRNFRLIVRQLIAGYHLQHILPFMMEEIEGGQTSNASESLDIPLEEPPARRPIRHRARLDLPRRGCQRATQSRATFHRLSIRRGRAVLQRYGSNHQYRDVPVNSGQSPDEDR